MNEATLRGYLLEEALSKLIENSGYSLITSNVLNKPDLYPEFVSRGNGLNLKGRGGIHQADVLGQFPFSLPFTYPVRLFLEAKFKSKITGIDVVRAGIGVLQDLNSNYQTIDLNGQDLLSQRYNYHYAIFSTSGFSRNAIKLAIAHRIHLIDLSGNEYADLRSKISEIAFQINRLREQEKFSLNQIRHIIRKKFVGLDNYEVQNQQIHKILEDYVDFILNYDDLYLASTNSPFTVLLKPTDTYFKSYLGSSRETTFDVRITWDYGENRDYWYIYVYELKTTFTFVLPRLLSDYIFKQQTKDLQLSMALNAKEQYLSNIIFYMKDIRQFITFNYIMPDNIF